MATVFTAVRGAGPGALDDALALHSAVWAASAHHALVGTIGADKSKALRAAHDQAAGLPGEASVFDSEGAARVHLGWQPAPRTTHHEGELA